MKRRERGTQLAWAWFAVLAASAVLAPLFFREAAYAIDPRSALLPPSWTHPFGTDSLGRDAFARVLCGSGVSLAAGLGAVAIATGLGVVAGAFAGYFGGWRDRIVMALADVFLCFPSFFLILAVIAILGPGLTNIILVIGATGWMGTARLVRAEALTLRERGYVRAAEVMGARSSWIVFRHIMPNAAAPALVNAVLGVSSAVLLETGLSFLGNGVQPPAPSWGNVLTDGKATLGVAWWLTAFPGLMILGTVLAANVIGESLQDRLAAQRKGA